MSEYIGDSEPVEFHVDQWIHKSRKEWPCSACKEMIPKGSKYHKTVILFDGEWTTTRRCARCDVIYRHLVGLCHKFGDGEFFPRDDLGCGKLYAKEWGELPAEIQELAFLSPGDHVDLDVEEVTKAKVEQMKRDKFEPEFDDW